jgi:hypothetical protein
VQGRNRIDPARDDLLCGCRALQGAEDRREEVEAVDDEQGRVAAGLDRGRTRDVAEERDLAEKITGRQVAQPASAGRDDERPFGDQVERVAALPLADDVVAGGNVSPDGCARQLLE